MDAEHCHEQANGRWISQKESDRVGIMHQLRTVEGLVRTGEESNRVRTHPLETARGRDTPRHGMKTISQGTRAGDRRGNDLSRNRSKGIE